MIFLWFLLGIAVVAQTRNVKETLENPNEIFTPLTQYHFKAIKISIIDAVVENFEIWRTPNQSRIDCYDHYKTIEIINDEHPYGIQYKIRPEVLKDQETSPICEVKYYEKEPPFEFGTILLDVTQYHPKLQEIGAENIQDKDCLKFQYKELNETVDTESQITIWVTTGQPKVPVRYEIIKFHNCKGSKVMHELWDFYDFHISFSSDVFNVDKYNCTCTIQGDKLRNNLLLLDTKNDRHADNLLLTHFIKNNSDNLGYKLDINQFSDETHKELNRYKNLKKRSEGKVDNIPFIYDDAKIKELAEDLPTEYDMRLHGLVTSVKNEEMYNCNSSWSFATTAVVEGALARVGGNNLSSLITLSNQALIDCAWPYGAYGCSGGNDTIAYEWIKNYGLPTEAEYGLYTATEGQCKILNMTQTYSIQGYYNVTPFDIKTLKAALILYGPVSVRVQVTNNFLEYSSGIFYDPLCDVIAKEGSFKYLTLVGYGEQDDETYWILKNSWGANWGIGGYMYISARDNNCGVATHPVYVIV